MRAWAGFGKPLCYGWLLLAAVSCTGAVEGNQLGGSGPLGPMGGGVAGSGSSGTASVPGGGSSAGGGGSTVPGGGVMPQTFTCASTATPDPGPSPLGLLSRTQYLNTLSGLFSKVPDLSTSLGADTNYSVTFGSGQADIDQVQVGGFQAAAETIATAVAADPKQLAALAPCATGADKRVCAQSFLQSFGALAYRSPITDPADIARHMAVYDAGAKVNDAHGLQLLIEAMLQSPRFLYRVELGTKEAVGASAVKLSQFEVAARLSYMVWDSAPDATLTAAATAGQLATKDQVAAQLTRMLADQKGASFVRRFLEGWTQTASVSGLVKDTTLYPQWSASGSTLPASIKAQASAFFDNVLSAGKGNLQTLLTSTTVFANKDLAPYYGSSMTDATLSPITVSNGQVSGLLTLPAVLSVQAKPDESWPIYRGRFVREELFCQNMPPPPPNIPKPPDVMPGVSTRARLTQHETNPACSSCHSLMDPIGFGFEAYDAIGRFRSTDGGQPVDATGTLSGTDVDGTFNGVVELGQKLASSSTVRECVARQWFRFSTNRLEQDADGCSMKSISDAFAAAGNSINALPQALVESDAFLYRRPIQVSQ